MEIQNLLYKKTYKHFRKRLFERYGITVGFKEYVNLHCVPLSLPETKDRSYIGYLIINGLAVKVAKARFSKGKPIVTALSLKKEDLTKNKYFV
ncbi:hypothetical protein [uncultured Empedobacter sp.]|uniref:hypothetical protein n=1 Tax=uncultured Empedobacter sp. TaxID=410844 RepID=UPI0025D796D5|nr:hypothetical protein [uncultured Empedobacter sp.]